jgi:hypothetical protein
MFRRRAERQEELDAAALAAWATERGIGLTLFHGWDTFTEQALFWADIPKPEGASKAVGFIHERLVSGEASPAAVTLRGSGYNSCALRLTKDFDNVSVFHSLREYNCIAMHSRAAMMAFYSSPLYTACQESIFSCPVCDSLRNSTFLSSL